MDAKYCKTCKKIFYPKYSAQKYCSEKCRKNFYRSNNYTPIGATLTCPVCGKSFIKRNGKQKYCSKECKMERDKAFAVHYRRTEKTKYRKRSTTPVKIGSTLICPVCGKTFTKKNNRQKYCSAECREKEIAVKASRTKIGTSLICPVCGKSFVKKTANQSYCSRRCAADVVKKNNLAGTSIIRCKICGKEFISKTKSSRYCSTECHNEAIRRKKYLEENGDMVGYIPTVKDKLTNKIEDLSKQNKSYGEDQIEKTLGMVSPIDLNIF